MIIDQVNSLICVSRTTSKDDGCSEDVKIDIVLFNRIIQKSGSFCHPSMISENMTFMSGGRTCHEHELLLLLVVVSVVMVEVEANFGSI